MTKIHRQSDIKSTTYYNKGVFQGYAKTLALMADVPHALLPHPERFTAEQRDRLLAAAADPRVELEQTMRKHLGMIYDEKLLALETAPDIAEIHRVARSIGLTGSTVRQVLQGSLAGSSNVETIAAAFTAAGWPMTAMDILTPASPNMIIRKLRKDHSATLFTLRQWCAARLELRRTQRAAAKSAKSKPEQLPLPFEAAPVQQPAQAAVERKGYTVADIMGMLSDEHRAVANYAFTSPAFQKVSSYPPPFYAKCLTIVLDNPLELFETCLALAEDLPGSQFMWRAEITKVIGGRCAFVK